MVTPSVVMSLRRYAASLWPPGVASTSLAPQRSGQNSSHTDTSKLSGVFCATTSASPMRKRSCIQSSRLAMAPWLFGTPLGRPVEPEV